MMASEPLWKDHAGFSERVPHARMKFPGRFSVQRDIAPSPSLSPWEGERDKNGTGYNVRALSSRNGGEDRRGG